jgi:serine/threonine protein kinase
MLTPLTDEDPRHVGPYRLHNRIGEGGMGTVYLAFNGRQTAVAVKVASAELSEDGEFRGRFQREVRAAQRVRGGAVATVLDADTDAERPWMVTEYVEGISLSDAVRQRGQLAERLVRGLAAGLADALVAIHDAGVVHRDLKPSNILLAWDGPKVIDFGIARLEGNTTLTRTGHVVGTLAWMAPEQMRGEPAGPPADVFSWGCCVAYAATGRHPFHAERAEILAYRIQRDPPDLDHLPDYLRATVEPALGKEALRRPRAADLLAGLTGIQVRDLDDARQATESVLERDWTGPVPGVAAARPAPPPRPATAARPADPRLADPRLAESRAAEPRAPGGWGPPPSPDRPGYRSPGRGAPIDPAVGQPRPSSQPERTSDWRSARADSLGAPPPAEAFRPSRPVIAGRDAVDPRSRPPVRSGGSAPPNVVPSGPPPVGPPPAPALSAAAPRGENVSYGLPPSPPVGGGRYGAPLHRSPGGPVRYSAGRGPRTGWNVPAVLSALLAFLWIFGLGSVAALVLGYLGRSEIRRRGERGAGLARAGIVLGWVGLVVAVAVLLADSQHA